mmetsp:Transcript_31501/g.84027  ORF Transcript_31501/g.84027 Transcript_31501/m.84027 type:complete len:433 (-) Transcript_31501:69-1367(-)
MEERHPVEAPWVKNKFSPLNTTVSGWAEQVDAAKLKIRSELRLDEWQQYGFATTRAAEFDAFAAKGDQPPGAVTRVPQEQLSLAEFWEKFERAGLPCLIGGTPQVDGWSAWGKWTWDLFLRRFADARFKIGKDDSGDSVRLRVEHFAEYMRHQTDDSPVYLFDSQFGGGNTKKELLQAYRVPHYFPDDFMAVAGDGRPPYRWIGVGPRRSGTVIHQDPLNTNAWNTLLCGRKRWVLMHPKTHPRVAKAKHVMQKGDDDEAVNYFLDLLPRLREKERDLEIIEFVQHAGETVFLPGGWWHCVVNLDDTIAVTQNYCGRINFPGVWRSARKERPCWSHSWLRALDVGLPEVARFARELNAKDGFDMAELLKKNRIRKQRRLIRREDRELKRARHRAGADFDEAAWRHKRRERSVSSSSESTVSTSTASSSTSSG